MKRHPKPQLRRQIPLRMMRAIFQSEYSSKASVRGAKMKVPIPEPQIATPVTKGLFLSKYWVMQSRRGK